MNWNNKIDEFFFNFIGLVKYIYIFFVMKKLLLKIIVKVFDLLGFLVKFLCNMIEVYVLGIVF